MSTIHIDLEYINGLKTSCEVIFTPLDTPWLDGNSIVVTRARSVRTGSNGLATITLLEGNYTLTFSGLGCDNADSFSVGVPPDNLTYNLKDLISDPVPPPSPPGFYITDGITGILYRLVINDQIIGLEEVT